MCILDNRHKNGDTLAYYLICIALHGSNGQAKAPRYNVIRILLVSLVIKLQAHAVKASL
jgi:hypothetical protein